MHSHFHHCTANTQTQSPSAGLDSHPTAVVSAHAYDATNSTVGYQLFCFQYLWKESTAIGHAQRHLVLSANLNHLTALVSIMGHRLLTEHVHAPSSCQRCVGTVSICRRRYDYRLNAALRKQLLG